jgi:uncharacterized protein (DUF58 family)
LAGPGFTRLVGFPLIFHFGGLAVAGIIAAVGVLQEIPALAALGFLILTLAVVAWVWSSRAARGLWAGVEPVPDHAFPGERVDLNLSVANRGWLPLSWLAVNLELPVKLARGAMSASPFDRERLGWASALGAGERMNWKKGLLCMARGAYKLGPLRLGCGDGFGLYPREVILPLERELVVYPRIVPPGRLAPPLSALIGEVTGRQNFFSDPARSAGVREYQPGDAFRTIHWTASARGGRLLVRQFESTTSLNLMLVIDAAGYAGPEYQDDFELALVIAASLANAACQGGAPFGLEAGRDVSIPMASGTTHLARLLDALARLETGRSLEGDEEEQYRKPDLPPGTTLLLITRSRADIAAVLPGYGCGIGLVWELLLVGAHAEAPQSWNRSYLKVRSLAELVDGGKGANP